MSLKILGAGFGRTGTLSLKFALDQLGFGPCHHMYEVRQSQQQVDWWHAAAMGQKLDWDAVFDGFQSQVDWPGSVYWKELGAHFSDAKVILTDRDPDAWYNSISKTILPASERGRHEDPDPLNRKASDMVYHISLQGIFEGRLGDRDFAIKRMLDHRQEVIDTIDADRLLVLGVGDGWKPLCDFLGVPVPDVAFPRGNSLAEFLARKPYLAKDAGS
ncbi:sulfotransferase family protein [Yoonia sp.]|nr:sulfotransferase family protein [Yoonia sp.]